MKRFFVIKLICLSIVVFMMPQISTAQSAQYTKRQLDDLVAEFNRRCPFEFTEGLNLTKVSVSHPDKVLSMYFLCSVSYESLANAKKNEFKMNLRSLVDEYGSFMKNDLNKGKRTIFAALQYLGYTLNCRYYSRSNSFIVAYETPSQSTSSSLSANGNSNCYTKAERSFKKGNYSDAEKTCLKAIKENENDWRCYFVLYQISQFQDKSSTDYLKNFLQKNSRCESLSFNGESFTYDRVVVEYAAKEYSIINKKKLYSETSKKAAYNRLIDVATIALAKRPHNKDVLEKLAIGSCLMKEYRNAEIYAKRLCDESEESGQFALGFLYGLEGRTSLAKQSYNAVLSINPNNSSALWNLANLYYDSREGVPYDSESNRDFQKSLELRIRAARCGSSKAIEWCKRNKIDW